MTCPGGKYLPLGGNSNGEDFVVAGEISGLNSPDLVD